MALNIRVDLEKTYAIKTISKNQELRSFQTVLKNGERLKLGIRISDEMHPILPNVYNLSFGPSKYLGIDGSCNARAYLYYVYLQQPGIPGAVF